MQKLLTLLIFEFVLFVPAAFAVDSVVPTVAITSAEISNIAGNKATFIFKVAASDNEGIRTLQYRARVNNGKFDEWADFPYIVNYPIPFTVHCNTFRVEWRSIDTSGNISSAAIREFKAPYKNGIQELEVSKERSIRIPRCTGKTPEACEDLIRQKLVNVKISLKGVGVNSIDGPYQDSAQPGRVFKTSPEVKTLKKVSFASPAKVTIFWWDASKKLKPQVSCPSQETIVADNQGKVKFESLVLGKTFRESTDAPGEANKALARYSCLYRTTFENSFRGAGDAVVSGVSTTSENGNRVYNLKVRLNLAPDYEMAFSPGVPPAGRLTFGPDNQSPHQNFMVLTKSAIGQKNYFKVAITEGNTGRYEVNPGSQANGVRLYLYDPSGNLISSLPSDQKGDVIFDLSLPVAGHYSLFAVKKGNDGSDREGFKDLLVIDRAGQSFTTLDGRFLEDYNGTYQEGFTAGEDEAITQIAALIVEIVNDEDLLNKATSSDQYSFTPQQYLSFLALKEAINSSPSSSRDIVKAAIQSGFYPSFVSRGSETLGRRDLLKLPILLQGAIAELRQGKTGKLVNVQGKTAASGEGAFWLSAPGVQMSTKGALLTLNGGNVVDHTQARLLAGQHIGLIGPDGGTLIGPDGGTLVGPDGGTLIGPDGGTLIGTRPLGLVGQDGGS